MELKVMVWPMSTPPEAEGDIGGTPSAGFIDRMLDMSIELLP